MVVIEFVTTIRTLISIEARPTSLQRANKPKLNFLEVIQNENCSCMCKR